MDSTIEIADRKIGGGHPCLIIAEAGINHNADPDLACRMIDAAAGAGADAIKFQTFRAGRLVAPKDPQHDLLRQYELSEEAHRVLWNECSRRGIQFLSSPFDPGSADFLDSLGVTAFKIASGELTDLRFLSHVARKMKPMIVSTGMATFGEVRSAVDAIRGAGNHRLVLLHCVSSYPASAEEANLRAMRTLAEAFGVPVGFSDHTPGIEVSLAAVALGAGLIEKHFTLSSTLPGPDQSFSLEPDKFSEMVRGIRNIERALGHGRKEPTEKEKQTARGARKSLVAARPIKAGDRLIAEAIEAKRPGTGLPPGMLDQVIGRTAKIDISEGTLLSLEMFL